jgi:LPS export ABC transporter protein LptC
MINGGSKYDYLKKTFTRMLFPGVLFLMAACNNDPEQIKALTSIRSRQEDKAEGVTVIYSKEGKIRMRLFADEFVRNANARPPYIDLNSHLKAEFYNDSGEVESVLTADSSRYYETEGNILVWDSVQIVRKKGEQLNTDELIWNNSIEKFFTEKPVRITTPNEVLYGNGMEANRDFTWYQILKPTGTVAVNKGEMPK